MDNIYNHSPNILKSLQNMQTQEQQACLFRAQQLVSEMKAQCKDQVVITLNQFTGVLRVYIIEKLSKQFGGSQNIDQSFLASKVEQSRMRFSIPEFNDFNPNNWDLNKVIKFLIKNFTDLFSQDFESVQQQSFSFQKTSDSEQFANFQATLQRIKRIKDKRTQSQELTARDIHQQLETLIEFFQQVRSFQQNYLSQNKSEMMSHLEQARLKALMNLSKEEQANQIIRILQGPIQYDFEYEGVSHVDESLLGQSNTMKFGTNGLLQDPQSRVIIEQYEKKVIELTSQLQTVQNQVQFYTINLGTEKMHSQLNNPERSTFGSSDSQHQQNHVPQQMFQPHDYSSTVSDDVFKRFMGASSYHT